MPSLTRQIEPGSPLHAKLLTAVSDRVKFSQSRLSRQYDKWKDAEDAALAYRPEREVDAERRILREGGKPQYTTIVIPYSYAILMAAHTYWTTVFLGRSPVMQFSGRHGESARQVQALEALMDYQVQVGGMLVPLSLWLLDAGKYGLGVVGYWWEERESTISEIVEEPELKFGLLPTGRTIKRRLISKVPGYHGNRLYNVRPYEWFPDPRVPLHRFQEGEYVAVYNEVAWSLVLARLEQGMYMNGDRLKKGDRGSSFTREVGSSQLELPESTNPTFDETNSTSDVLKIYECYVDLIPSKWGLGKGDSTEKWVITVTSDYKLVIGCQPLGAWHNKFPFECLEFEPEAHALVNRGIPEILEPVQNTIDWLLNTHFYNVRKALNDQFIVDPSRVMMTDVQDPLPGGIIRLRPEAFGQDPATAIKQLQVVDLTQTHMRDLEVMLEMGQRTLGINDQILGAVQGGGRKTATEIRTSSAFGISRLKTSSEYFSAMGFQPLAAGLVSNTQQYYDMERKFRIVGDLMLEAGQNFAQVTPADIQGFFDYVPVDGTLPVDRFAQANLWREILAQMRNFPTVMQQYDIGRIFGWVAQLAGLKNINQFKLEISPDQALAQQLQAGNVTPIGDAARVREFERAGEPGQVSGLGQTT